MWISMKGHPVEHFDFDKSVENFVNAYVFQCVHVSMNQYVYVVM